MVSESECDKVVIMNREAMELLGGEELLHYWYRELYKEA
jgi:hypothetical protein